MSQNRKEKIIEKAKEDLKLGRMSIQEFYDMDFDEQAWQRGGQDIQYRESKINQTI